MRKGNAVVGYSYEAGLFEPGKCLLFGVIKLRSRDSARECFGLVRGDLHQQVRSG